MRRFCVVGSDKALASAWDLIWGVAFSFYCNRKPVSMGTSLGLSSMLESPEKDLYASVPGSHPMDSDQLYPTARFSSCLGCYHGTAKVESHSSTYAGIYSPQMFSNKFQQTNSDQILSTGFPIRVPNLILAHMFSLWKHMALSGFRK